MWNRQHPKNSQGCVSSDVAAIQVPSCLFLYFDFLSRVIKLLHNKETKKEKNNRLNLEMALNVP